MKTLVKILIAAAVIGIVLLGVGVLNGGELYTGLQDGRLHPLGHALEELQEEFDPTDDFDF